MKALLALMLMAAPAVAAERCDTAIVFTMDISDSMSDDEVRLARDSHAIALTSEEVVSAINIGRYRCILASYVEFSETATVQIEWSLIDGAGSAAAFARRILEVPLTEISTTAATDWGMPYMGGGPSRGGGTSINTGLEVAAELLSSLPVSAERLVVDVVGDGEHNGAPGTVAVAQRALLDMGVTINGLPLLADTVEGDTLAAWYANNIRGGPSSFSLPSTSLSELPQVLRQKLVTELF